ncbi:MAG: benzoate-CoA ligase family protein [Candidatus Rokuibacteriota bacterium]
MANATAALLDDRVEAWGGDRPAIVTPAGTTTYRELLALVSRAGHALRMLGVEPGDRVAMLLPDGLDWAVAFLGALRIGAVAVPLNPRLAPAEWLGMLRDSGARALIADPDALARLGDARRAAPDLEVVLATGEAPGAASLPALLAGAPETLAPERVSDEHMAFWLYTSGTTGAPKAAVHAHRGVLACRHYGLDVLGANARDRFFATSKLFFAYALGNALLIPLYVGAQTYLHPDRTDPAGVAAVLASFRPTLFFSVPTFYARLLQTDLPPGAFRSVRCAVSAGERLPAELYWAFRDRFDVEVLDGMGATETVYMVLSNRPGLSRAGSSGTPVPGTEVRLVDVHGREAPDGVEGVLHVRTPSASPGYWGHPEQSRAAFAGDWFRTGDVYVRDADGFYQHRGREDDRFKVAGMWVAPADVEAALLAHPDVADAGVVGAEEEGGLVKAFAFVVPKQRGTPGEPLVEALARLLDERLAPYQRPRRIFVVDELPRTATGKLQRLALRRLVQ